MSCLAEEKLSDSALILRRVTDVKTGSEVCGRPSVSVVIPAYRNHATIAETLESVFAQTFRAFEVVVVNDGSPETAELRTALEPFLDRIIYAEQENKGAAAARNAGIALSRGDCIAFIDADDIWLPDFLESQMATMHERALDMVHCDALLFGEPLYSGRLFSYSSPSLPEATLIGMIETKCNIVTSATVVGRKTLERSGLFDIFLRNTEDFDLWFRIIASGARVGYSPKVLVKYRVETTGLSGSTVDRTRRSLEAMELVRAKHTLSDAEVAAFDSRMRILRAEHEVETGKSLVVERRFKEAADALAAANRHFRKAKISLMILVLRTVPSFAPAIFRLFRPSEYAFVSVTERKNG